MNQNISGMNPSGMQQHYNQVPVNAGYRMQQQSYGGNGVTPMQTVNTQPYVMGQYMQNQSMGQYQTMNFQNKKPNPTLVQRYSQQQELQRQQMIQKQMAVQNQGMGVGSMYMQNRQLTPEQMAYQQRLQQQQQLQQLQKLQQLQYQAHALNSGSSSEQEIQALNVPEHYFDTPRQQEERESNSIYFYQYEIINSVNKLLREKKVGCNRWH